MQKWLTVLTQDLLQVSRLAESMRYRLSASVPYDRIVQSNLVALQERPYPPLRQISRVRQLEDHRGHRRLPTLAPSHRCHGEGF